MTASRYIKGRRKLHKIVLNAIAFLDINVCINNPYWESSAIIKLFCL